MADIVYTGAAADDNSGDNLRASFAQINQRFQQLLGTLSQITWTPGLAITATPLRQWTINAGQAYVAASNHTAGATFAGDLALGLWLAVDVAQLIADLASPAPGKGAFLVSLEDGRNVQDLANERVTVTQFDAIGDGVASDTAAFIAAYTAHPGKTIYMPEPSVAYKIDGLLTIPAGTIFKGDRRHGTKLLHAYNGDFADLGEGAGFEDCLIDGQGATYTGRCFVFSGTRGRQVRRGVKATDFDGEIEYFGTDAGSSSIANDVHYERRAAGTGTDRYAVVIDPAQKLGAVPRKFVGYESGGTCSFDFGGSNNTYVNSAFLGDLKFTAESRAVFLNGVRWANQAAATLDGHNVVISGDIGPQLTIASGADFINTMGATYNNSTPIIDNSDRANNYLVYGPVTYTPTLTSGGTAPVLGNGSISGVCSRTGNTVTIQWKLTVGSTTTLGSGALRIGMPTFQPNKNATARNGVGSVLLNRGGTLSQAWHLINTTGSNYLELRATTGVVTATSPATFATGDTMEGAVTYQLN